MTQPEELAAYSYDGTPGLRQLPAAVVMAENEEQIIALLQWANRTRTPIVPRGSGTGLSGGSVPTPGSVVLCTARMNRILEVDAGNLTLLAEAGATTQAVADAAQAAGLFYPPDPGSIKIATIGGNVAENSGGLRGLKYGVTRDYILALDVVLPTGEATRLGTACVKDVAGFSLKDLFIGSEGLLGIVTRVLVKLIPPPQARQTLLATYSTMKAAAQTASAILAAKIVPCTLEFLDQTTLRCVETYAHVGLPIEAQAVILVEVDGHPAAVEEEARAIEKIAGEQGALKVRRAQNAVEATQLATARRSALAALAHVAPTTILEDVTVPRTHLAEMVEFIQKISIQYKVTIGTFGHFGDGNLHPTFLTNEKNLEEMERVEKAMAAIFEHALALGGTITGEHGVGLAKKKFLKQQLSPAAFKLTRELKKAMDPNGILNPGKIYDAAMPAA